MGLFALVGVLFAPATAPAQAPRAPDLDVIIIFEVRDTAAWLALQEDVYAASANATKVLQVAVTADSGETRSVVIAQPKFTVSLVKGAHLFKVMVTGKIPAAAGFAGLGAFEYGVLDAQQRARDNQVVGIYYGLSNVAADLLEMHVTRP